MGRGWVEETLASKTPDFGKPIGVERYIDWHVWHNYTYHILLQNTSSMTSNQGKKMLKVGIICESAEATTDKIFLNLQKAKDS